MNGSMPFSIFQIGYSVVRALADYRLTSRYHLNLPQDRDLKVSIATETGPATTWHVTTSQSSKTGFREEVLLGQDQINKKIYFLATGNGCSTLQVNTFLFWPRWLRFYPLSDNCN